MFIYQTSYILRIIIFAFLKNQDLYIEYVLSVGYIYTYVYDRFDYRMVRNKRYDRSLMDIYFITQVFLFVHFITNKLHCSLFADHNIQFPNIAFRH